MQSFSHGCSTLSHFRVCFVIFVRTLKGKALHFIVFNTFYLRVIQVNMHGVEWRRAQRRGFHIMAACYFRGSLLSLLLSRLYLGLKNAPLESCPTSSSSISEYLQVNSPQSPAEYKFISSIMFPCGVSNCTTFETKFDIS